MSVRSVVVSLFLLTILTASGIFAGDSEPGEPSIVYSDDSDGDGIPDDVDNCPTVYNPGQEDGNNSGVGDACDCCENMGDFDHNARIDVQDVVAWVAWAFKGGPVRPGCVEGEEGSYYYPECDTDGSGRVDIADMHFWVRWAFNYGPSPDPCPGE